MNFGTICKEVPLEKNLEDLRLEEFDKEKLYDLFKELRFTKYIEKLGLENKNKEKIDFSYEEIKADLVSYIEKIEKNKEFIYYLDIESNSISFYLENKIYFAKNSVNSFKEIFESNDILKISYKQKEDYINLYNLGIVCNNMMFDIEIAAYILDSTKSKYELIPIAEEYLGLDLSSFFEEKQEVQLTFDTLNIENSNNQSEIICKKLFLIQKLYVKFKEELEKNEQIKLFDEIEMPLLEVLASMEIEGMHVDKKSLEEYGKNISKKLDEKTKIIYELAGEEFNVNSTKQLGEILFEKLKLPVQKKNKTGYSTDNEVLEKLNGKHQIIQEILEYRQIAKIKSTYVDGLLPLIDEKDSKIHSKFHQTVTATGRISSTDPNLQNIPIKVELGKELRKVFTTKEGFTFLDADYSQIELRVLACVSKDENMLKAFKNDEDIHLATAAQVLKIPASEVTSSQRSSAKAVNFGIVYGISDYGLGAQLRNIKKRG